MKTVFLFFVFLVVFCGVVFGGAVSDGEFLAYGRGDRVLLVGEMKRNYDANVRDYTGRFDKQERVRGELLEEQSATFKFREDVFSLFMEWTKNPVQSDRLLYVVGANDGKMVVHPTGWFSWIRSVKRDPRCAAALKYNLRTCDQFGMRKMLDRLEELFAEGGEKGCIEVKYLGESEVDGRRCFGLEVSIDESVGGDVRTVVVQIDVEYRLPVSVKSLGAEGELMSRYRYWQLEFNTGLGDDSFDRKTNRL